MELKETNMPSAKESVSEKYEKHTSKSTVLVILAVVLFLFSATILAGVILYVNVNKPVKETKVSTPEAIPEITYTKSEVDRMIAEASNSAYEDAKIATFEEMKRNFRDVSEEPNGVLLLLREYYPNDVVFQESNKFGYYPIDHSLKPNKIDLENLVYDEENARLYYMEDGATVSSIMGVDVSSFQKNIDWKKAKAAGVEFAIIRCAFRGYGTGKLGEDSSFATNIVGAREAGVKVGVYVYSQAINEEEAREEAEFALELIAPYQVDYPVVIDIEEVNDKARTDELTTEERTANVVAFCETIKEAGYTPMIYSNQRYFIKNLDMKQLDDYEKWYAQYNTTMYFPYEISMWQYSNKAVVEGIPGEVDINISLKDWGD